MLSKFIRFLGSVRLAVPLLAAIAFILIGATLWESHVGAVTVQRDIYKSVWFGVLMLLLAMNLGVSTFARFPWRGARKIGFALTHIGLIVIIAGSAAVIHLNTEGMLLIRTDGGPRDEIRVEGDLLDVITPDQQHLQTDIFVRADGSIYPQKLGNLALLGYTENAVQETTFTDDGSVDSMAVQLSMHSDRMGQTLDYWLAEAPVGYQTRDLGPASLEFLQVSHEQELDPLLNPPDQSLGPLGNLVIQQSRQPWDLDVAASMGKVQKLSHGLSIEITDFWPDFRLNSDGQPTTASQQLRNPAIQLLVSQNDVQERWYIFGNSEFPAIRTGNELDLDPNAIAFHAPSSNTSDFFRVIVAPNHDLYFAANSSQGFSSGPLSLGQPIVPGWADFQLTLEQVFDHAQIQRTVIPTEAESVNESPALLVETPSGIRQWLPWGEPQTLSDSDGNYFAAFSPKVLKLPFQVQLNDFIVERNEGSDSIAMWTSDVNLRDENKVDHRRVWMNHPTWFKGWKLAQASWNPGDLNQSTLQLKREPWWVTALTWLGSLLVVSGIGTMFYGRAIAKRLSKLSPADAEAQSDTETVTTAPA